MQNLLNLKTVLDHAVVVRSCAFRSMRLLLRLAVAVALTHWMSIAT